MDAEKVNQAVDALMQEDVPRARQLLEEVVTNRPDQCDHELVRNDTLCIKFWDQHSFVDYVLWMKQTGNERSLNWIPNAYPRALYYLGYLLVHLKQYEAALGYLDRGMAMEPSNPRFHCEKAQALMSLGRHEEALGVLALVIAPGPYVSERHMGAVLRARGFALIELSMFAEAERCFVESLRLDPTSPVARNELQYIQQLKTGGAAAPSVQVPVLGEGVTCALCGKQLTDAGHIAKVRGKERCVCPECLPQTQKRWWQFWR